MMHQPRLDDNAPARVRVTAWVPPAIARTIGAEAAKQGYSGSGYMAAVITRHALAIDMLASGMDGHQIAKILRMTYADTMKVIGREVDGAAKKAIDREVDDAAKGRWP